MKNIMTSVAIILIFSGYLFAQHGSALFFDGIDNYVDFGTAAAFDIDSAVTYEAWIRPDSSQSGFILNKWVSGFEDKLLHYSSGRVYFYLFNTFAQVSLGTSSLIPLHEFTHIAATYDGSTAKIYVNGLLDTLKDVSSGAKNNTGILYAGFNPDRFDFVGPFMGIIDEVRIWNIVLSAAEIQTTMNQPLGGNEEGLAGCWDFDEGTGTTTADKTVNGNDGTIHGAVWVNPLININETDPVQSFSILQNYPNPFNPSTTITYNLPFECSVEISVYNSIGQKVKELINGSETAGEHTISFNAGNFATGIYIYQIKAESLNGNVDFRTSKKMMLLR